MSAKLGSTALTGADSLVRELGGDLDRLVMDAGLPPETFCEPDVTVTLASAVRFFSLAATRLDCPNFGLRLAQRQDLSVLGPLYLMMQTTATIGDALLMLSQYLRLHSMGLLLASNDVSDGLLLEYDFTFSENADDKHGIELGLGLVCNFIRARLKRNWHPVYAQFRHGPPKDIALHQRIFGSNILFDQECNAICIDPAALVTPIDPAAHDARAVAIRMIRRLDSLETQSVLPRTETIILNNLSLGYSCSIERVASEIGFSKRSLQRALFDSGTSFEALRSKVRAGLAKKYLLQSRMSVAEIAYVLGFSQPSALTRAFKIWYGNTPLEFRKKKFSKILQ